jgi:Rieske Fe-S protein
VAELQKDPITRGDFLGFGVMGAIVGAILTIPPVAFVLSPIIKTDVLGESDVGSGWVEVAPVADVGVEEPSHFKVEFPLQQTYGERAIQDEFPNSQKSRMEYTLTNAIWLSWKAPIKQQGRQGSSGDVIGEPERPAILDEKREGFTESERKEIMAQLNVLSNSCAHLGCPVRWFPDQQLYLCPCHGGLYDINGGWVGGPPPRGMYRYTDAEVREDGKLYVKHKYDIEPGLDAQEPYVV